MGTVDNRFWRTLGLVAAFVLTCSGYAASPLTLNARPLFLGMADSRCFPMLVSVQNKGPDTEGDVEFDSMGVVLHYPLELPRGSLKSFIAYPPLQTYMSPCEVRLSTGIGDAEERWTNPNGIMDESEVLVIDEHPGAASFLRHDATEGNPGVREIYGQPELLPERGDAYGSLKEVMLGDGAERMSDSAVAALKEYVLTGGTLVFLGGASPAAARDPRWSGFCPVRNLETETLPRIEVDTKRHDRWRAVSNRSLYSARATVHWVRLTLDGPITVATGTASAGATITSLPGNMQTAVMPYGTGIVLYCAADPFDGALANSPYRGETMRSVLLMAGPSRKSLTTTEIMGSEGAFQSDFGSYGYAGSVPYSTTYYRSGSVTKAGGYPTYAGYLTSVPPTDPFHMKLPPVMTILEILLAYFVLVVPINLLVLRRLGRGEWAWVTAPVISVAFAAIFFHFTAGLYSASRAKLVSGCLIADYRGGPTYSAGYAQLFFPRGGSYNLQLGNTECLLAGREADPRGGASFGMYQPGVKEQPIDIVDDRGMQVPSLQTSNLSFDQLAYTELAPRMRWVETSLRRVGDRLVGVVKNQSTSAILGGKIILDQKFFYVGELEPSQSKSIDSRGEEDPNGTPYPNGPGYSSPYGYSGYGYGDPDPALATTLATDRMLFIGMVQGFDVGPRIASQLPSSPLKLIENLGGVPR